MKAKDVLGVGHTYIVKVSGHLVPVKLMSISPYGGWIGRNTVTGREIRIRTAGKLRREVLPPVTTAPSSVTSRCTCSHSWNEHTSHASGSQPCKHFGCGCSNFDRVAPLKLEGPMMGDGNGRNE